MTRSHKMRPLTPTPSRKRERGLARRGFTLLEMMIALGILAISLMWLVEATSRAIAAENHAKLISTATFLARGRLVELEEDVQQKGFTDDSFGKEESGDFEERGFKRFRWTTSTDKVELPTTDQVQGMVSKAIEAKQTLAGGGDPAAVLGAGAPPVPASSSGSSSSTGAGGPLGAAGGLMSGIFPIVKDVLEHGIQRAHVTVAWVENGREQKVELVEYITEPRRVDMAITLPSIPGVGNANPAAGGSNPAGGNNPAGGAGLRPAMNIH